MGSGFSFGFGERVGSRFGIYKCREVESMEYIDNDDESVKLSFAEVM